MYINKKKICKSNFLNNLVNEVIINTYVFQFKNNLFHHNENIIKIKIAMEPRERFWKIIWKIYEKCFVGWNDDQVKNFRFSPLLKREEPRTLRTIVNYEFKKF